MSKRRKFSLQRIKGRNSCKKQNPRDKKTGNKGKPKERDKRKCQLNELKIMSRNDSKRKLMRMKK